MSIALISNVSIACTPDTAVPVITDPLPGFSIAQPIQSMELEVSDFSQYFFLEAPVFGVTLLMDLTETVIEHNFFGDIVAELPVLGTEIILTDPYTDGLAADLQVLEFDSDFVTEIPLFADLDFSVLVVEDISGGSHDPDILVEANLPSLSFDAEGTMTVADYAEGEIQEPTLEAEFQLMEHIGWLLDIDLPVPDFEALSDDAGWVAEGDINAFDTNIVFGESLEWSFDMVVLEADTALEAQPWVMDAELPVLEAWVSMGNLDIEGDIPAFVADVFVSQSIPSVLDADIPDFILDAYSVTPLTLDATFPLWGLNTYTGDPNVVSQWVEANLPMMTSNMAWHTFTMDAIITPISTVQRTAGYIDGY